MANPDRGFDMMFPLTLTDIVTSFKAYLVRNLRLDIQVGGSLDCYEVFHRGEGVAKCSILVLRNI